MSSNKSKQLNKKQEDNETLKLSNKMKTINIEKPDDDIDGDETVDVKGKYGNMKSIKVDKDKLSITPSIAHQINKKQEAIEEDEIEDEKENDIDFDDTISLLDMALSEIPTIGIEDWGKDDELLFTADTKVLFENLKDYEEEIPKYYYDNASNDDWSNGIDDYLMEMCGVNINNGDSDNTYNWNAPLTHDVEFTIFEGDDGCYFKGSIHRAGDVRGNYTTEFLLKFDNKDDCLETLFDTCNENCYRSVTVDGVEYVVSPHFFNEYVDIWNTKTQESYEDVYCDCIDKLKEIIAENSDEEPIEENKSKKQEDNEIPFGAKNIYDEIKNSPRTENYNKGLQLRDEILEAWKNKDLETAYTKWSELFDLFHTGYDENGNPTSEWSNETALRDAIELTMITDTIEDNCVYDVTDYGKQKAYKEMGYI